MKKFLILLSLFISVYAIEMNAWADFTPCLPDCENDVWVPDISLPASTIRVTLPGCTTTFVIRYRYRIACNQWYDYYIEGVESTDSPSDINECIRSGYAGNMALFLRAISEGLIIANPANFPPYNVPDCELMWRVLKGACWFRDFVTGIGGGGPNDFEEVLLSSPSDPYTWGAPEFLAPCPSIHCCLEKYRVCRTEQGLDITLTDYQPPMDPECADTQLPTFNCVPVCGSIYHR